MNAVRACMVFLLMVLVTNEAKADNNVAVTSTAPGCTTGSFVIKGTVTVATGSSVGDVSILLWQDGCLVSIRPTTLTFTGCNTYSFEYDGAILCAGPTYNVVAEVTVTNSCMAMQTIASQPTTVSPK